MKYEIISSVELKRVNGSYDRIFEFSTPQAAIQFLDKSLRCDEFIEGSVKVNIKKGK